MCRVVGIVLPPFSFLKRRWLPETIAACVIVSLLSCAGQATDNLASGTMYGIGDRAGRLLYRWNLRSMKGNGEHWLSQYIDGTGMIAAEDELFMKDGKFAEYRYLRYTSGERADVRAEGDKIVYEQQWGPKTKYAKEQSSSNFVTGPYLFVYIQKNWIPLVSGETLTIRFGVPDLLRSYEFYLSRDKQEEAAKKSNQDVIVIKMTGRSFFVRLFVNPILLEFVDKGQIPQRIVGRTLPVEKHGQKIIPVDGDLLIEPEEKNFHLK